MRDDVAGIVAAVSELERIKREVCRDRVARLYSAEAVTEGYLDVYRAPLEVERRGA